MPSSHRDRYAQEGCGNGGGILARACVLAVEQIVQLGLQIVLAAVGCCSFERVHRRPVIRPERGDKFRWCTWKIERVGIPLERDLLFGHSRARESLDHVLLDAPGHRTDESFRRWWRVGGADLQDLGDERWVVG